MLKFQIVPKPIYMKKLITSLIISMLFAPLTHAVTFYSDHYNSFAQYQTIDIFPTNIIADADGEITAEHGINIMLEFSERILWNVSAVTASGTAVDNGRVDASFTPTYLNDYKALHIPVNSDWLGGETLRLSGVEIRAYNRQISTNFFKLDMNGDFVADAQDITSYQVSTDVRSDITPPYPITDLTYTVNEDKTEVQLNWNNPPDYDFIGVNIERDLTRNGVTSPTRILIEHLGSVTYTDADIQPTDQVTYHIYTLDPYHIGEAVDLTIDLNTYTPLSESEEPGEPSEDPMADEHEVSQEERDSMSRLYTSYKVRHEIKCQRDDSPCLWAKINLIYTQEILELSDVETSISDRDLYLLGLRIKWPEQRFQDKCVEADVPDKTCTALGRSLKRAHYFLERNE